MSDQLHEAIDPERAARVRRGKRKPPDLPAERSKLGHKPKRMHWKTWAKKGGAFKLGTRAVPKTAAPAQPHEPIAGEGAEGETFNLTKTTPAEAFESVGVQVTRPSEVNMAFVDGARQELARWARAGFRQLQPKISGYREGIRVSFAEPQDPDELIARLRRLLGSLRPISGMGTRHMVGRPKAASIAQDKAGVYVRAQDVEGPAYIQSMGVSLGQEGTHIDLVVREIKIVPRRLQTLSAIVQKSTREREAGMAEATNRRKANKIRQAVEDAIDTSGPDVVIRQTSLDELDKIESAELKKGARSYYTERLPTDTSAATQPVKVFVLDLVRQARRDIQKRFQEAQAERQKLKASTTPLLPRQREVRFPPMIGQFQLFKTIDAPNLSGNSPTRLASYRMEYDYSGAPSALSASVNKKVLGFVNRLYGYNKKADKAQFLELRNGMREAPTLSVGPHPGTYGYPDTATPTVAVRVGHRAGSSTPVQVVVVVTPSQSLAEDQEADGVAAE